MNRKLYIVTIELEAVVYANSESEAEEIAKENLSKMDGEMDDATFNAHALPRHALNEYASTIPWGEENDRTVAEIIQQEALKP